MKKWKKLLVVTMALTLIALSYPAAEKIQAAEPAITPAIGKTPERGNPLLSHKFGADPSAMVYDGRVYIYMTNDIFEYNADGTVKDNTYGKINKITVISSADMVNWTDHGEIPAAGPQGAAKWANNSWAPAAAHQTIDGKEKFFLYFADSGNGIGVLTADSPTGPFTDPIGGPLVSRSTPGAGDVTWLFDPAVLVDDDGSGYLYFGGGIPAGKDADPGTARVAKLGADMISFDLAASGGSAKPINPPWLFEDSGINKYNGKYYYSYCTNFSSGHPSDIPTGTIAYMVSDNPMGPFEYVKTILPNPAVFFGVGGNNHHAIFEFKGEWYITYHAQTLAKAMAESGRYPQMGGQARGYRNAHINKITFDENGVIQDTAGDYAGVPQAGNLEPYTRVEAETIAWNGGISTENIAEPGELEGSINLAVTGIHDGDWTAVSNVDFGQTGAGTFSAHAASGTNGGRIELHLDSPDGRLIGTLPISNTGGDDSWQTKTINVSGATGVHDLYMVYRGAPGSTPFKIDYWQFGQKSTARELAAINATIDKHKIDVTTGQNQAALKVTAVYADGTCKDVTSKSVIRPAQDGIVSIKGGKVTGIGYGSTNINVSYEGKTDILHMLVKNLDSELKVKQITVDKQAFTLEAGRTASFKVTVEYADGRTEDVTSTATYSNTSPDVADVANGKITAKSNGTAQVTVSFKGALGDAATAQITVTVKSPFTVAIEAETAAENSDTAYVEGTIEGHTWSLVDGQSTKAMLFGPDTGFTMSGTDSASLAAGSKMSYKINVPAAGNYYVWLLASSVDYSGDSVHVGVDNQYRFTSNGIHGVSGGEFKWANLSGNSGGLFGGEILALSAGEHELNFWGREDGLSIDRIYLTTSTSTADPVWPPDQPQVPTASLSAADTVKPGESFVISVNLDSLIQTVYAEDIILSYDADVFDYVSSAGADDNIQIVGENTAEAGKVRLVAANVGGVTGASTPLLRVTFQAKAGVHDTTGTIAVARAELGVNDAGEEIEAGLTSTSISVGSAEADVDKTALAAAITTAQGLYDAAEAGTQPGQYPQSAIDALLAAVNAAKSVQENERAAQSEVDDAAAALNDAVEAFRAAVVKEASADLNEDGRYSVGDLAMIANHYGKDSGSPDWSAAKKSDMNHDGKIDIVDLTFAASKILKS